MDDLEIPGRYPEVAPPSRRSSRGRADVERPLRRLAVLDPRRRRAHGAGQPAPRRARPRGDARLGPAVLLLRPGARGLPADRRGAGRASRFDAAEVDARIAARFAAWWTPGWSRRCARWRRGPAGCRAPPARRWGTASCWPTSRTGVPLEECVDEAVAAHPAVRPPPGPWFRRDPRDPLGSATRRGGPRAAGGRARRARLTAGGCETGTVQRHQAQARATTSWSCSTPTTPSGSRSARCGCWRTGAGRRRRRDHPRRARAATAATCPWSCATPTARGPR